MPASCSAECWHPWALFPRYPCPLSRTHGQIVLGLRSQRHAANNCAAIRSRIGASIALSCFYTSQRWHQFLHEYDRIFSTNRFNLRHERNLMNLALAIRQCGSLAASARNARGATDTYCLLPAGLVRPCLVGPWLFEPRRLLMMSVWQCALRSLLLMGTRTFLKDAGGSRSSTGWMGSKKAGPFR